MSLQTLMFLFIRFWTRRNKKTKQNQKTLKFLYFLNLILQVMSTKSIPLFREIAPVSLVKPVICYILLNQYCDTTGSILYEIIVVLFYLSLCKHSSIEHENGHYCSYTDVSGSFIARRHFTARGTTSTAVERLPWTLCQNHRRSKPLTVRSKQQQAS